MGGGDLNSKKSWHPNNLKNQERVWKAEQAASEESKRIMELQRERELEKDRAELNEMAKQNISSTANGNRLHWMYDKPDKTVQQEDYLLGKAIDKSDRMDKAESEVIPAVARRIVGSSMLSSSEDTQVDLVRKIREDPLLLVKERERAARAALLNNPLQRRRLAELLRKEQEQKKNKVKKKSKKKAKDLDNILAVKLNALGGQKQIDLAALLASGDNTSSDSSPERHQPKMKKKKKKQEKEKKKSKKPKKKKRSSTSTESSDDEKIEVHKSKGKDSRQVSTSGKNSQESQFKKRKSSPSDSEYSGKISDKKHYSRKDRSESKTKRSRREDPVNESRSRNACESNTSEYSKKRVDPADRREHRKREGLSEEERANKLAAMVAAGAEREVERGHRVARQRAADAAADSATHRPRALTRNEARELPDSLESRIRSNRHYIQRDRRHMNEHFARR